MVWPWAPSSSSSSAAAAADQDQQQQRLDDTEPVDVHSWGDKETHIRVSSPEGFAVKVRPAATF